MPKRDPHAVLGVDPGASAHEIRAAWRRLAREHHPDRTAGDATANRSATRRMAEINAAYEALRQRPAAARGDAATHAKPSGPPRPRPTKPVTGRLDMTGSFRPRNSTTGPRAHPPGQPPPVVERTDREGPRASDPTGPLRRSRVRSFRPEPAPALEDATALVIAFGKFHGHTLAEVAAFEPSYIDWLARTISRDPDLVAAARVVQEDLDRRGVVRHIRPESALR